MPSYAILGATGTVGSSVVSVLLDKAQRDPAVKIHAYCRSKQKLLDGSPGIADNDAVRIFDGSLDDKRLLSDCFRGTSAIFVAIAQAGNKPGNTLAADTARKVLAALDSLHSQAPQERLPKLVVLSSASTEHRLMSASPPWALSLLYTAFSNIYDDLKAAEEIYRATDLTVSTFMKPGALSDDEQKGHVLSLDEAITPVSFLDLAAGMLEVADDVDGRYDGIAVAVNAAQKTAFPWQAPLKLLKGLLNHFFPFLYPYIG